MTQDNPTSPTLVVLAAGVGSRYGGLKQLAEVGPCGETLLEYSIFDALRAGFGRVVLIVQPDMEAAFRDRFEPLVGPRTRLDFAHQRVDDLPQGAPLPVGRVKPWGTGHALLAAASVVNEPFVALNADDFYGAESFAALAGFLAVAGEGSPPSFALIGFEVGPTLAESGSVSRAICEVDGKGRLAGIVEVREMWKRGAGGFYVDAHGVEREVAADRRVSMNIWALTPAIFPELRSSFREFLDREGGRSDSEFLVPDVIEALVRERRARVDVLPEAGSWCGITYPEDRRRVSERLAELTARGVYPSPLWGHSGSEPGGYQKTM
jgi:MobA-like NTP transferase domain